MKKDKKGCLHKLKKHQSSDKKKKKCDSKKFKIKLACDVDICKRVALRSFYAKALYGDYFWGIDRTKH